MKRALGTRVEPISFGALAALLYAEDRVLFFTSPSNVSKVEKTPYGLKQAPRAWYGMFSALLIAQGSENSVADTSLFTYKKGSDILFVSVYADHILLLVL